jgi:hypothetical protein
MLITGIAITYRPPQLAASSSSCTDDDECFIVRDANGQALAYVYFEDEPGEMVACRW